MYLGYMKRGLFYLLSFGGTIAIAALMSTMYVGVLNVIPYIAMPVVWIYAVFDCAHTRQKMKRDEIEFPEDNFDFEFLEKIKTNRRIHKIAAVVMIFLGSYFLLTTALERFLNNWQVYDQIQSIVMPLIFAVALIAGGIKLLMGTKKK